MTTTETTATAGKAPTHIAYHVKEGKDKGYWNRIGAAWQHKDGNGFNVQIDCTPHDGRITLRIASDNKD